MEELVLYVLCFLFVYLLYVCLIILRKKKLNKYRTSTEVRYLEGRYQIDIDRMNLRKLANTIALLNAFIIANVVTIIGFIDHLVLKLCVGFVVLIPMILIVYHLLGKHYQKKYGKQSRKTKKV